MRLVVDESLISPKGWMMLDSLDYLKAAHVEKPAARPAAAREDILDLAVADLSVVRLTRSENDNRAGQAGQRGRIPRSDIVAIGGTNLEPRSAEQPFDDASDVANDNLGRVLLLVALLVSVVGGYALTAFAPDNRRAIEVTPPDSPAIRISSSEQGSRIQG
jgi:hypothetical protein